MDTGGHILYEMKKDFQNRKKNKVFEPAEEPADQTATGAGPPDKKLVQEGQDDAARADVKKQQQDSDKLDDLVQKAQNPLISISSVFPFMLFPTKLSVEPTKVNITNKEFIASEGIQSIYIKNITDVIVQTNPFFASIKIVDMGFISNNVQIEWLKKEEALKARRIIQGLIIAHKNDIDLSKLNSEEIAQKIEELGAVHEA